MDWPGSSAAIPSLDLDSGESVARKTVPERRCVAIDSCTLLVGHRTRSHGILLSRHTCSESVSKRLAVKCECLFLRDHNYRRTTTGDFDRMGNGFFSALGLRTRLQGL